MEPFYLKEKSFFTIEKWEHTFAGLTAGFTTKNGGISNGVFQSLNTGFHVGDQLDSVRANREKLSHSLAFPLDSWVGAEQTHDVKIRKISKNDRGKGSINYVDALRDTDGLYTNERGILLTLCFADCVPIFFLEPASGMIGVAHAGWKGTVNGIAGKMIDLWRQEGIHVEKILAVIGPSICKKCYIVDNHVMNFVQSALEHVEKKPYNQVGEGQYSFDLREMNKLLLMQAGISKGHISTTAYCSSCHQKEFFSHRRDAGKTGRMMSFVGWREDSNF